RRRRHGTDVRKCIATLKERLEPYGFADAIALFPLNDKPLPRDLVEGCLDLDAAAEADLLLNLWHSLTSSVVSRLRLTALVDTDPGLLQTWMTTGALNVAPHDIYFTVGEAVGTPAAPFPDCGLRWHYTPPPVFLPEWPQTPAESGSPYTTVAHWWGGSVRLGGEQVSGDKLAAFLEYARLPAHTPVPLEQAICLGRLFEKWRACLEPLGWRLRDAWDVSATPEQYRAYIQRSRGEFSCAKPTYVKLATGWVSDRTACYLASGKPGATELLEALQALLGGAEADGPTIALTQLKRRVYRVDFGPGPGPRSLILKRSEPTIAQLNRLVAERWLPAIGLGDRCAPLLATVAERQGRCVWQIYEDLGDETLDRCPDRSRVESAVELVAELHTRAAEHPLLPEVRHHSKDLGLSFFMSNVADAIRGLEALPRGAFQPSAKTMALRDRLLDRLYPALTDAPRRAQVLK